MYFRPMLMSNVLMFLPKRIFSALKNGVICSSVSYELFPNVHEDGGVGYQFLYEGDELKCYEHGLLIESVE